jgi:hypothetical protein
MQRVSAEKGNMALINEGAFLVLSTEKPAASDKRGHHVKHSEKVESLRSDVLGAYKKFRGPYGDLPCKLLTCHILSYVQAAKVPSL